MNAVVIVPFRDKGHDPLRKHNLTCVLHALTNWGVEVDVVDDGRNRNEQFCRSASYNRGSARHPDADILVFCESDMLIDHTQIAEGINLAASAPGLVVPFSRYCYLTPEDSERVRRHEAHQTECVPEATMDNGTSIGAINIVSRETLQAIGQWDEHFNGSWYDDRAMCRAFEICTQPTRYITGPAYHLFHQPGWKGDHLTAEDKAATQANKARWKQYRQAATPEQIRALTCQPV